MRDVALLIGVTAVSALAVIGLGAAERVAEWAGESPRAVEWAFVAVIVVVVGLATVAARQRDGVRALRAERAARALTDPLTGLPNRHALPELLTDVIRLAGHRDAQASLILAEVLGVERVNDDHGYDAGDQLLRAVADRLVPMGLPHDRVARYGGTTFALVSPEHGGAGSAEKSVSRVLHELGRPFTVDGQQVTVSACAGLVLAETRGAPAEDVLRDATLARHLARADGPGSVIVFDRARSDTLTPTTAAAQVRAALEAGEFQLHYQPVVDLRTGRISGAEALLRWVSPSRGHVPPSEFIPILEETGLIVPVGTWVLEEACREADRLRRLNPDAAPLAITVNVAARQLLQPDFGETVRRALAATGLPEGQIHLEITEAALLSDLDAAWTSLRQAKAAGVKLALDDFGTGYSSLSYIRRFNLDMLKIDKSFVDGIDTPGDEDRIIVGHVVAMASRLGMTTVAEGVERPEQLAVLRDLGCCHGQGFAFSRALGTTEFEGLCRRRYDDPFRVDGPLPALVVAASSPAAPGATTNGHGPGAAADGTHTAVIDGHAPLPLTVPHLVDLPPAGPARPPLPRLREYRPDGH